RSASGPALVWHRSASWLMRLSEDAHDLEFKRPDLARSHLRRHAETVPMRGLKGRYGLLHGSTYHRCGTLQPCCIDSVGCQIGERHHWQRETFTCQKEWAEIEGERKRLSAGHLASGRGNAKRAHGLAI